MYKIGIADPFRLGEKEFALEKGMLGDLAQLHTCDCKTEEELIEQMQDFDVCCVVSSPFTKKVIDNLPKCKGICRYGIGLDNIDIAAATEKGIQVCYDPTYCVEDVAVHAFIMMQDLSKKVTLLDRRVRDGDWGFGFGYKSYRLEHQVLGFIGFGNIARHFAKLAQAYNMEILMYDPYLSEEVAAQYGAKKVEMDEVLASSDFVSVNVPLTPATRHIVGYEQLKKMKPSAFLINVSRGALVDTDALVRALREGLIQGAGLDVHEQEPLSADHPLKTMENVILTPHAAFYTEEAFMALRTSIMQQAISVLKKERPSHIANPEVIAQKEKEN